jgi:2-polyprenyl-6-methoxyphenol hydroxylase-like FAD-dependent oxidoreductase
MTALPTETDVLIAGAGPTGLTLGALLAAKNVPAVVIDAQAEGANTSRAAVVHARTLEVLEELDATEPLRARGVEIGDFTVHDRRRTLMTVPFGGLPTAYPFTLMVPQDETEAVLLDRLHKLGGTVHRPFRLTALEEDADAVVAHVAEPDGTECMVRAKWVVGADGMHSTVRDEAGIGFGGGSYRQSFVLADVRMKWPREASVEMLVSPEGVTVVAPLPDDRYRIVATVDDAPREPGWDEVSRILDARGPGGDGTRLTELLWTSRFRIHRRVAGRFRAGRVLLAGDAAHVHSPAGGQGMNTGIQDAVCLGHALTAVVHGRAGEERLDAYEAARRPVALQVVSFTDRMTRMATVRNPVGRVVRNLALTGLGRVPAFRHRLAMRLAELHL